MPATPPAALLLAADTAAPVLAAEAEATEQNRELTATAISALEAGDLFRLLLPAEYGGPECDPITYLEIIERLAAADGSAGWCANIASTTATLSWYLEPEWARTIWATRSATGGAFAPSGKASRVEGGWECHGQWAWGSGTQHSTWVTGGTITDTGDFHLMFFPASEVRFLDTWYSSGLRGTGSTDFAVDGAIVPDGRSVLPGRSSAVPDAPLARFPNFNMLAAGVASSALGIARRAIDELVAIATQKTPLFARSKLAEYVPAQMAVAQAEAELGSARSFLRDSIAVSWEIVQAGDKVTVEQRARVRLACAHAATAAARATDLCYNAAGGTSVYTRSPLQRCFRDVHTATAHLMVSDRNLLTAGRLRFGLETDVAML